jgi:hypothetical protein
VDAVTLKTLGLFRWKSAAETWDLLKPCLHKLLLKLDVHKLFDSKRSSPILVWIRSLNLLQTQ